MVSAVFGEKLFPQSLMRLLGDSHGFSPNLSPKQLVKHRKIPEQSGNEKTAETLINTAFTPLLTIKKSPTKVGDFF